MLKSGSLFHWLKHLFISAFTYSLHRLTKNRLFKHLIAFSVTDRIISSFAVLTFLSCENCTNLALVTHTIRQTHTHTLWYRVLFFFHSFSFIHPSPQPLSRSARGANLIRWFMKIWFMGDLYAEYVPIILLLHENLNRLPTFIVCALRLRARKRNTLAHRHNHSGNTGKEKTYHWECVFSGEKK